MKLTKLKLKQLIKEEIQNILLENDPPPASYRDKFSTLTHKPLTSKETDLVVKALGEMPPYECQKYNEIKPPKATGLSPEFWPRPKEWPARIAGQENPWPPRDAHKCTKWLISWTRNKRRELATPTKNHDGR